MLQLRAHGRRPLQDRSLDPIALVHLQIGREKPARRDPQWRVWVTCFGKGACWEGVPVGFLLVNVATPGPRPAMRPMPAHGKDEPPPGNGVATHCPGLAARAQR